MSQKAIFIRNPKCATISIRGVLQHGNRGVRIDELETHQLASKWKDTIKDYNDHFVFSVCRNPYDRLLSAWLFICRRRLEKHRKIIDKYKGNFTDFVLNLKSDFEMKLTEVDMVTWPQHKWFLDQSGDNIIDDIGRFENLNEWWLKLCKQMRWPQQSLPKRNSTKHKSWQDHYNPAMIKIVNQQYERDFKLLNYKMF